MLVYEEYLIDGLRCMGCVASIEQKLRRIQGVQTVSISLTDKLLGVSYDEQIFSQEQLQELIESLGFKLLPIPFEDQIEAIAQMYALEEQQKKERRREALCGLLFLLISMGLMLFHSNVFSRYIQAVIALVVYLWIGRRFHLGAIKQIRHGIFSMDTLVSFSTSVVMLYSLISNFFYPQYPSYYDAVVMIISFVSIGKWIEDRATQIAHREIRQLSSLQAQYAHVVRDEQILQTAIRFVRKKDKILIKKGEEVPVDGILLSPYGSFIESSITGEAQPATKYCGEKVYASSLSLDGPLYIQVTEIGKDTLIGQILESVKHAERSKAPIQRVADRIAGIFVPVIFFLALICFLLWGFLEANWIKGMLHSIALLVTACPCALGLATPLALSIGIGRLAKDKILFHKAEAFEKLSKVDTFVFDKTGTLTMGIPQVVRIKEILSLTEEDWSVIYTMERGSIHPIAKAIADEMYQRKRASLVPIDDVKTLIGEGMMCKYKGRIYYIGKGENKVLRDVKEIYVELQIDGVRYAEIYLSDQLLDTTKEAINQLNAMDYKLYMLTGDRKEVAHMIGEELGITHIESGLLPSDKRKIICQLKEKGACVAMVGDGINDTEALVVSDFSMAISQGAALNEYTSDATLMDMNLLHIPRAITIAKRTEKIIRENFLWAFVYNLVMLPVAAGLIPFVSNIPIGAFALMMALSSLSVVLNSLRLKRC